MWDDHYGPEGPSDIVQRLTPAVEALDGLNLQKADVPPELERLLQECQRLHRAAKRSIRIYHGDEPTPYQLRRRNL